ncbi:hypothetical protein KsCSTR_41670 [Candidatus Kuenenia stuttgartiensis]|uniref:Uncharacterized protein n=1 Tax=Kuenenia stuttgartiensis TaxID=174633 RepID=Q1PXM1_KUEST|nr:hypothetical protein KsCSTR_41670 [Candidatus Kuenenia stuttgartiensis]CAJ71968.1 unknown protein [Candidatus Kuenenia stuttgartiensis]
MAKYLMVKSEMLNTKPETNSKIFPLSPSKGRMFPACGGARGGCPPLEWGRGGFWNLFRISRFVFFISCLFGSGYASIGYDNFRKILPLM